MGIIGHETEELMSRKEYLRHKKKEKYKKFKLIPILLSILILLLSIYVYKQLHLYNTVTSITNKVVEQNALNSSKSIYYIGSSYTKENSTSLIYFNSSDDSRQEIKQGKNLNRIQVTSKNIYGIYEDKLYKIDRVTYEKKLVVEDKISGYLVNEDNEYIYISNIENKGIYKVNNGKKKYIIKGTIYQMMTDNKNIYVIMNATTAKSIVKFDMDGNNKQILSGKCIVSNMLVGEYNIYFANRSDNSKIYCVSKKGSKLAKITDKEISSYSGNELAFNKNLVMVEKDGSLYYIQKQSGTLSRINIKKSSEEQVLEKQILTIQIVNKNIYYTQPSDIGIYHYDNGNDSSEKITSARMTEYICLN